MELGLTALHVIVGVLFIGHGAQKLFGAFGGHGLEGTAGFFESIGLRPGKLHATGAGLAELGGGVLLALGLLTPLAAGLIIATMTAAILTVHVKNGPWVTEQGYEYNLVLIAVAFALVGAGAGWSVDDALNLDVSGTGWALGALGAGLLGGIGAVLSGRLAGPAEQPAEAVVPAPAKSAPAEGVTDETPAPAAVR